VGEGGGHVGEGSAVRWGRGAVGSVDVRAERGPGVEGEAGSEPRALSTRAAM
jgi:hypothetical protein